VIGFWLLLAVATSASPRAFSPGTKERLVDATTIVDDLLVDLRYATSENFLQRALYPKAARCLLRESAARKLGLAARLLRQQGFRLRIYDCYRPPSVQWEMWKAFPRRGYVADPRQGSPHSRGAAVDLTLASAAGNEVEMPTEFDSFTPAAHHGYRGGSAASRKHREILCKAMEAAGFRKNRLEWWHYQLPDQERFSLIDEPVDRLSRP
jgi:D-alanyl-D-alanine dipeptidase